MSHGYMDMRIEPMPTTTTPEWDALVRKLSATPYRWEPVGNGPQPGDADANRAVECSIPAGWFEETAGCLVDDLDAAGVDLAKCVVTAIWSYDCDWCVRELKSAGDGWLEREHVLCTVPACYIPPFDTSCDLSDVRLACAQAHPELDGLTLMLSGTFYVDSATLAEQMRASLASCGFSARIDRAYSDPYNHWLRFDADEMSVRAFLDRLERALAPFPAGMYNGDLEFERVCEEDEASGGNIYGKVSQGRVSEWRKSSVHPAPFEPFTAS